MASIVVAFPVLHGQTEAARRFATEVAGPRRSEFLDTLAREEITREEWYLQQTPNGDMVIVTFDSPDPAKSLANWATADSAYEVWFIAQVQRICGVDLREPMPALPERILSHNGR
ncbi:MAG TPA: hypothetical protein VGM51_16745 [Armatimonadota bacterium]|jgi:hypothetical protein